MSEISPTFPLSARPSGDNRRPAPRQSTQAPAGSIWYNGDFDGVDGLSNELNTSLGSGQFGHTYDDFNVTDPNGWHLTAVYSNNLENTNITGATWEIRQGLSEGNPRHAHRQRDVRGADRAPDRSWWPRL